MSEENPLPRSVRETAYEATASQTVFGPPAWLLWDEEDVLVYRAAPGSEAETLVDAEEYTVTPTDELPGTFTIVFDTGQSEGATIRVKGARVHERLTNVTQAGVIRSLPLERELDRIGVVLQELRRDNDRSVNVLDDCEAAQAAAEEAQEGAETAETNAGTQATAALASSTAAAASAALAAGYAAGLNLPAISGGDALKLLQVKADETGYQHAAVSLTDYPTKANNLSDLASQKAAYDNLSIHGADVASAGTVDLDAATGNLVDITGTTAITAITLAEGRERVVRFTGALTLTHGASLVLPGAANIVTAAGDYAIFRGYGSAVVRCVHYLRAAGRPLNSAVTDNLTVGFTATPYDHGTKTTGSYTPEPDLGPLQIVTNNGAHTLTAPTKNGCFVLMVTNAASAGAITFSGFEKQLAGDTYATTNGLKYAVLIYSFNSVQFYQIKALQ